MSASGSGTALLCLVVFASTVCVGAFGPLLPEIARAQGLPDWQLGRPRRLASASRAWPRICPRARSPRAGSRPRSTLAPVTLLAGMLLLCHRGPVPVLVLGRILTGLAPHAW